MLPEVENSLIGGLLWVVLFLVLHLASFLMQIDTLTVSHGSQRNLIKQAGHVYNPNILEVGVEGSRTQGYHRLLASLRQGCFKKKTEMAENIAQLIEHMLSMGQTPHKTGRRAWQGSGAG